MFACVPRFLCLFSRAFLLSFLISIESIAQGKHYKIDRSWSFCLYDVVVGLLFLILKEPLVLFGVHKSIKFIKQISDPGVFR